MKLPFDQYQRYKHSAEMIDLIRESGQTFRILEVGANEHKNLEKLLEKDNITYLDIIVPDHLQEDPSYIQGDATSMPLEDNSFDFVVALDVFEHILPDKRKAFLNELSRSSKIGFIISAPFETEGIKEAEERANLYFKTLYGYNYQWLEEHVNNGLPLIEFVKNHLNEKGLHYFNFAHGSIDIWETMTKAHFLGAGREVLYDYRFVLDSYYNNFLYEKDYQQPCYRNFFVSLKESKKLEAIKQFIDKRRSGIITIDEMSKFKQLREDFVVLSDYVSTESMMLYTKTEKELSDKNADILVLIEKERELQKIISNEKELFEKQELLIKAQSEQIKLLKEDLDVKIKYIQDIEILNEDLIVKSTRLQTRNENLEDETHKLQSQLQGMQSETQGFQAEIQAQYITIEAQKNHILEVERVSQQLRIKNRVKRLVPGSLKKLIKKGINAGEVIKKDPTLVKKTVKELKNNGINTVIEKANSKLAVPENIVQYIPCQLSENDKQIIIEKISGMKFRPLISIVMPVYNVDPHWLELAINSVVSQIYDNWELCIVDDCSTNEKTKAYLMNVKHSQIKVIFSEKNNGISETTNKAIAEANGDYIALLDNDDEITVDALAEVVMAINKHNPDLLYSDEDKMDQNGNRKSPFYKPDWSPDLLRSQMYVGHLLVFKKELFEKVGGFRKEFDGSQDYDLMLRMSEKTEMIHHIDKVLYSWRELESSTAMNPNSKPYAHHAGLRALNEHLERVYGKEQAWANEDDYLFVYDARYNSQNAKASIIIPTKDKIELVEPCVQSILNKTDYPNYEIIILNNNSVEAVSLEWFERIQTNPRVKVVQANYEFNWSKLNNHGIRESQGDVYVFLNNDTLIMSEDWLQRLVEKAMRKDTGTVGALLLYEDRTIQHAGVVIGMGGWADHVFKEMNPVHYGSPFVSPMVTRNVSSSTGACLAISRRTVEKIGSFDENFIICGSDVEISIRASQNGLFNVYDPHVELYHLESKSRDSYIPPIDFELSALHYKPFLENGDPFYNRNLDLKSNKPRIK